MSGSIEDIVAAALTVPGWTETDDARAIVRAALDLPANPMLVEIGVYMGRCTALLAGARRGRGDGMVHCIDPFDGSGDAFSVPHYANGVKAAGFDSLEEAFRAGMTRLGLHGWYEVHRASAARAAAEWYAPIQLLLLDGDQSPAGARLAFELWAPFLVPGGTLVLRNTRDREYAEGHDGHRRLVEEELIHPHYRNVLQVGATTIATKATE